MTAQTFFSYARADRKVAIDLAQRLRAENISIWVDVLDIPTGTPWDDAVESALASCENFVVLLSDTSVKSQNVRDEIAEAIRRECKIVPILIERCRIPFRISRLQYVDLSESSAEEFSKLLSILGDGFSSVPHFRQAKHQSSPQAWTKRGVALSAAAVLGVIALGLTLKLSVPSSGDMTAASTTVPQPGRAASSGPALPVVIAASSPTQGASGQSIPARPVAALPTRSDSAARPNAKAPDVRASTADGRGTPTNAHSSQEKLLRDLSQTLFEFHVKANALPWFKTMQVDEDRFKVAAEDYDKAAPAFVAKMHILLAEADRFTSPALYKELEKLQDRWESLDVAVTELRTKQAVRSEWEKVLPQINAQALTTRLILRKLADEYGLRGVGQPPSSEAGISNIAALAGGRTCTVTFTPTGDFTLGTLAQGTPYSVTYLRETGRYRVYGYAAGPGRPRTSEDPGPEPSGGRFTMFGASMKLEGNTVTSEANASNGAPLVGKIIC